MRSRGDCRARRPSPGGEVGTGKTTLVRQLLDTLRAGPDVLVLHPTVEFDEILDHLLLELSIPVVGGGRACPRGWRSSFASMHATAPSSSLRRGAALRDRRSRRCPSCSTSSSSRARDPLVLAGQPELDGRLAAPALARVRARARRPRVRALSRDRVAVHARPARARQARDPELFTAEAIDRTPPAARASRRDQRAVRERPGRGLAEGSIASRRRSSTRCGPTTRPCISRRARRCPPPRTRVLPAEEAADAAAPRRRARARAAAVLLLARAAALDAALAATGAAARAQVAEAPPPSRYLRLGTIAPSEDAGTHTGDTIALEPAGATPRAAFPLHARSRRRGRSFWRAYQARGSRRGARCSRPTPFPRADLDVDPTGGGAQPADRLRRSRSAIA
jgi:hypothetical protein